MVVGFNVQHLFKFPVDIVVKTYINQINNNDNNSQGLTELQHTKDDSTEMECLKWITTWDNCFPSFFQRLSVLQTKSIRFYEEIWSQWKENRHWIRRRNLTWEDEAEIGRLVYISQHEHNPNWTYWEETGVINFVSFGSIGYALEMYLKRKLKAKSYEEIRSLEKAMLMRS
uniref:PRELI/MSF1 domain-containing protein n=2 Tax=Triatoma infestans TaxID=30076 RepID=A0A023F020_TRIIF